LRGINGVAQVVRLDASSATIQVVDVVASVEKAFSYPAYSLRELAAMNDSLVIISGGSPGGGSLPTPEGLLVSDGHVVAPLNRTVNFANGVFCVSAANQPTIIWKTSPTVGSCKNALQSGPLLIEPQAVRGIHEDERRLPAFTRSLVGIDRARRLYFIVTPEVHLYDLMLQLMDSEKEGGLSLTTALVLGRGAGHAGMVVRAVDHQMKFGDTSGTLPSAITAL
jgi:uncharacterized protein YigE (DUF2233 family)